jgi:hypothetical protein
MKLYHYGLYYVMTYPTTDKEVTVEFPLPIHTVIAQGEVVGLTTTAYRVVTPEGDEIFVPFYGPKGVHALTPAEPLVVIR